jgi:GT2 family glycosyltransferase
MTAETSVVAVVVTYRSGPTIADCLAALGSQLDAADALVVVDNASPGGADDVAAALERTDTPAARRFVPMDRNVGFGRACNRGAAEFPDHHVLLVNPDAVLEPGALRALREFLADQPRYGAVGPLVERFDGSPEPGCRRSLPNPAVAFGRLSRLDRAFPNRFGSYNRLDADPLTATDIEAGSGCCVLIRRQAWDAVGGFDPRFFMYAEDLDLFLRLGAAGWRTRYLPEARVLHHKGASTDTVRIRMLFEFHRAMWAYYRKHHMHGAEAALAPFVATGLAARFVALAGAGMVRKLPSHRTAARTH